MLSYLEVFTETDELPLGHLSRPLIQHGNCSYAKQKLGHRDETEGGPHNPRRGVSNRYFPHSPQEGPTAHTLSVSFQQSESFFISLAHQGIDSYLNALFGIIETVWKRTLELSSFCFLGENNVFKISCLDSQRWTSCETSRHGSGNGFVGDTGAHNSLV